MPETGFARANTFSLDTLGSGSVAAISLAQRPDAHILDRLNRWGRLIFPLAMLTNFVLAFLA